jgi:hypothetical protein
LFAWHLDEPDRTRALVGFGGCHQLDADFFIAWRNLALSSPWRQLLGHAFLLMN